MVKGVLETLAFEFSDEDVDVDTTVGNAARIWKLYGTTARKGDDIKGRPHRRSTLLTKPEGGASWEVVDREKLEAVAAMRPALDSRQERAFDPGQNGYTGFDLAEWIKRHDVPVKREGPWKRDDYRYILEECPINGHTDGAAYIVRFANGAIAAGCHHNSCRDLGWRDFREHYEPGAYERNGHHEESEGTHLKAGSVPEPVPWPTLAQEAYHGLPGNIVRTIEPHTEADPVAVLMNLLSMFGNAIGMGAYFE